MPNRLEMLGAPADVSVRRRSSEPNGDVADARPTVSAPPDPRAARGTHLAGPRRQLAPDRLRLSDGELNFLWWFIQGSIMNPETRFRLHRRWGMCQRHSLGFLTVDAAFRHGWFLGPAVLYDDLMERAVRALHGPPPIKRLWAWWRLRETGPCLMCEIGYGPESPSATVRPDILEDGRDLTEIMRFIEATRPFWQAAVCGRCDGSRRWARCRAHLREALEAGEIDDLPAHETFVQDIARRVTQYAKSFQWEHRGSDTIEDRAALVAAVGWCGGWPDWLTCP